MKNLTIWEYICSIIALITLLYVMTLVSSERLNMLLGLRITYFSTLPFMMIRSFRKRGKYIIYCLLYLLPMLFFKW